MAVAAVIVMPRLGGDAEAQQQALDEAEENLADVKSQNSRR